MPRQKIILDQVPTSAKAIEQKIPSDQYYTSSSTVRTTPANDI